MLLPATVRRTAYRWEPAQGNTGDGPTYAVAVTGMGGWTEKVTDTVEASATQRLAGELLVGADVPVAPGDRFTVDGLTGIARSVAAQLDPGGRVMFRVVTIS
ncbi:MAG TPA: hypothetical protein VFV01_47735 [Spirillospora sp.]|nr:hypothetical protein [Spirillospora sp.]